VHSVDPHLGAPPWFGLAPHKRTLDVFKGVVGRCGLDRWVRPHLSDSASLAAVWPAEGVDAVLIDGDHSFLGALKDFEGWAPKVKPGGLVLFDDAGGPLAELNELIDLVRGLRSVSYAGIVDGIAVFERNPVDAWSMLDELSAALAARRVYRPWDLAPLHGTATPPRYRGGGGYPTAEGGGWPNFELGEAYMIAFHARCGPGPYGYTAGTRREDQAVLDALSRDRRDGPVVELDGLGARLGKLIGRPAGGGGFRAILCRPEEAATYAQKLMLGGALFARHDLPPGHESTLKIRQDLLDAGLTGVGATANLHWGIWQPHHLSPEAIIHYAMSEAAA
jgi:hypothetical protein